MGTKGNNYSTGYLREWMMRLALCLETGKPQRSEVSELLRTLATANVQNGTPREDAEQALLEFELKCGTRDSLRFVGRANG